MARSVFKKPELRNAYETCRRLFDAGEFASDAAPGEMYGVMHKQFWNGFYRRGQVPTPGSASYAAWCAGVDAKITQAKRLKE